MKVVELTQGYVTRIDDADLMFVNRYRWKILKADGKLYAARTIGRTGRTWGFVQVLDTRSSARTTTATTCRRIAFGLHEQCSNETGATTGILHRLSTDLPPEQVFSSQRLPMGPRRVV